MKNLIEEYGEVLLLVILGSALIPLFYGLMVLIQTGA